MMIRSTRYLSALLLGAFLLCNLAVAKPFTFIGVGDMPYNEAQVVEFGRSIEKISTMDAEFVLHVGDIKGGGSPCDESVYAHRAELYGQCALPFVVIVGDNEFNDCADPMPSLGWFRKYFCADDNSLGQRTMPLERQSKVQPEHTYPEQVRWSHEGVLFLGFNVVGSSNHFGAPEDWKPRTAAGLAWLKAGFAKAKVDNAAAVVVAIHANPFSGKTYPECFAPIMTALEDEAHAFGKPVLLMHGDTHYFRWDVPFKSKDRGGVSTNLSRLEVFGSPNPHWVEIMVDPKSPQVFAIRPHYLEK
jgi:hypothetical protein